MAYSRTTPNRDADVMEALRHRLEHTRIERTTKVDEIIDGLECSHPATLLAAEIVIRQALTKTDANPFEWFKAPLFGHPRPTEILPGILSSFFTGTKDPIHEALVATGEFYQYWDFQDAAGALGIPERYGYERQPSGILAMNRVLLWQSSRFADEEWREVYMTPNGDAIRSVISTGWILIYAELLSEYVEEMAVNKHNKNNSVAIAAMVNGRESLAFEFLRKHKPIATNDSAIVN